MPVPANYLVQLIQCHIQQYITEKKQNFKLGKIFTQYQIVMNDDNDVWMIAMKFKIYKAPIMHKTRLLRQVTNNAAVNAVQSNF